MPWKKFDSKEDELEEGTKLLLAGMNGEIVKDGYAKFILDSEKQINLPISYLALIPLLEIFVPEPKSKVWVSKDAVEHMTAWVLQHTEKEGKYPDAVDVLMQLKTLTKDEE